MPENTLSYKYMKKLLTLLVIALISFPSFAMETAWQTTSPKEEGAVRLITAGYTAQGDIVSGIHMKFSGNWHTYWKVPGDSGMAITPDFSKSENISSSEMQWPVPKRDLFFDLEGWGYGKEVIMPVVSKVADPTKPAKLVANVKWAVCDENCIFVENDLTLDIPSNYKNDDNAQLIAKYQAQVPVVISEATSVKLTKLEASEKSILAEFTSSEKVTDDVDLFIHDATKNFRYPKPVASVSVDGKTLSFVTNYEVLKKGELLTGKNIQLTLVVGKAGYETAGKVTSFVPNSDIITASGKAMAASAPEAEPSGVSLLEAIIAAIIGGLILNIMPCVLPVILLKIFGVLKHGASDKKYIRKSFSYTVAGIISSFLVLAAFVVILKSFGHSVGWGIQFQQPAFLILISILLTLFAANQFGWFEIVLPHKLSDKVNKHIDNAGDNTPLGNFLTGAFATLLATPCTAPFVTTAISFAFAADTLTIFAIMFFMGVGLALPYLLIMISPSLVKILPKPGRWINVIRVILGLLLFFTNFWIFWIFMNNGGVNTGFMLLFCMILTIAWLGVATKLKLNRTKTLFTTIYFVLVTFGMVLYLASIEKEPAEMKDMWVKFNKVEIQNYVQEGRVVFVDITADWCLTCKFNKANVTYPMKPYFDENKVVMMKGDYTLPSKEINEYLEENKVYGIPFNKVYGPHAKDGIRLPEILKEKAIKDAVEKAK